MPEDTAIPAKNPLEGATVPLLPPVALDTMNQNQLKEFVPELIRKITGKTAISPEKAECKPPNWWPPEIPWVANRANDNMWTESLRSLVRSFYSYLGQENRVSGGIPTNGTQKFNLYPPYSSKSANQACRRKTCAAPFDLVDLGTFPSDVLYDVHKKKDVSSTFLEVYICYFCEREFKNKDEMQKHQSKCENRPALLKTFNNCSPSKETIPHSDVPFRIEKPTRPPRELFLKVFDLIPKENARKIRNRLRSSVDVQCDHIDVTVENPVTSPVTPKTPKLLISQLSCDAEKSSSEPKTHDTEYDSDVESVLSSQSSEFDVGEKKRLSLLNIEVTSLLGKRIHQHVKSDVNIPIINAPEPFCRTPSKNRFVDKLRTRNSEFPVTYRPIKRLTSHFCHQYKFNKAQNLEFMETMKTGLDRGSRELLKSLPTCKVLLRRLSKQTIKTHTRSLKVTVKPLSSEEIIMWTSPIHSLSSNFPVTPILKSSGIDQVLGLKKKSSSGRTSVKRQLSLVNVVSEEVNAEVAKQKLAIYKSLLHDVNGVKPSNNKDPFKTLKSLLGSGKFDQPVYVQVTSPTHKGYTGSPSSTNSSPKSVDDQLSIKTISSDDESIRSGCCLMCQVKKSCDCSSVSVPVRSKKVEKNLDQMRNISNGGMKKIIESETVTAENKTSPKSLSSQNKNRIEKKSISEKNKLCNIPKDINENVNLSCSKTDNTKMSSKSETSKNVTSGTPKKSPRTTSSLQQKTDLSPKSKNGGDIKSKSRSPLSTNCSFENKLKKQSNCTNVGSKKPKSKPSTAVKAEKDCSPNNRSPIKLKLKINSNGLAEKIKNKRTLSSSDVQVSTKCNSSISVSSPKKKKRAAELVLSPEPCRKRQKCS